MNWKFWRMPTPAEIAKQQLAEAERDYLHHKRLSEFHESTCKMLTERAARLRTEINAMGDEQ